MKTPLGLLMSITMILGLCAAPGHGIEGVSVRVPDGMGLEADELVRALNDCAAPLSRGTEAIVTVYFFPSPLSASPTMAAKCARPGGRAWPGQ